MTDLADRLMGKIAITPDGCWAWQACRTHDGYGRIQVNGKARLAHRVAYELFVSQVPEGLQLDHLCRVRHCINPDHLEPVTGYENIMRGDTPAANNAAKTHCPRGHELAGWNLQLAKDGARRCYSCARDRDRENKRKARGADVMANPQRRAGIAAELEACRLLEDLLGYEPGTIRRRANEGVRLDVGDLIGVPDTCVQVTRIGAPSFNDFGRIGNRARIKASACTIQQDRAKAKHGVVLMRLDGQTNRPARWRAVVTDHQLLTLGAAWDSSTPVPRLSQGFVIRDFGGLEPARTWMYAQGPVGLYVATLQGWATSYQQARERAA